MRVNGVSVRHCLDGEHGRAFSWATVSTWHPRHQANPSPLVPMVSMPAVPAIIYGFGGEDDKVPLHATAELVSKLVGEYILGMVREVRV